MNEKFKNLPVEPGTFILATVETKIDDLDAVYQKWCWDSIFAESIIFCNDDVAHLNQEQVEKQVLQNTALVKDSSSLTYRKGDKFTFVSFNFDYD